MVLSEEEERRSLLPNNHVINSNLQNFKTLSEKNVLYCSYSKFSCGKLFIILIVVCSFLTVTNFKVGNVRISLQSLLEDVISIDNRHIVSNIGTTKLQVQRVGYEPLTFFGSSESVASYKFLQNYDGVIEPHVRNFLKISDGLDSSIVQVKYELFFQQKTIYEGVIDLDFNSSSLNEFMLPCTPYDEITALVEFTVQNSNPTLETIELKFVCMYVRRELRTLLSADLAAAMDAIENIWTVSEEEGQSKYGSDFHSSSWFTKLHHFNAGWMDGDHIHEGLVMIVYIFDDCKAWHCFIRFLTQLGFIPQHIKMSNMFELAMQAVDPSVSLFYWDFTYEEINGIELVDSPMFQDNTFGELTLPRSDYWGWTYTNDSVLDARIKSGRFKDLMALSNPSNYDMDSGYGYMRGAWSLNPSPYVSRFTTSATDLPSCHAYYSWLETMDFNDFFSDAENGPHAATHGAIGGVYGCDVLLDMLSSGFITDEISLFSICAKWSFYVKEMYRGNLLTPNENCDANTEILVRGASALTSAYGCGFSCEGSTEDDFISFLKTSINLGSFTPSNMTEDGWKAWRTFICEGSGYRIFGGDHLESASPQDPSFWPIHPNQERLLQLKYMVGGFDDFIWPLKASLAGEYVCNHAMCYDYRDKTMEKDFYSQCCYGHYEFDQLLDFTTGNRSQGYGPSNHDTLASIDPTSSDYSANYIYDDFSWSHCPQDFDGLARSLAMAA